MSVVYVVNCIYFDVNEPWETSPDLMVFNTYDEAYRAMVLLDIAHNIDLYGETDLTRKLVYQAHTLSLDELLEGIESLREKFETNETLTRVTIQRKEVGEMADLPEIFPHDFPSLTEWRYPKRLRDDEDEEENKRVKEEEEV